MAVVRKAKATTTNKKVSKIVKSDAVTAQSHIAHLAKRRTSSEVQALAKQFEIDSAAQTAFNKSILRRISSLRKKNAELVSQYRDHVYSFLQEAYAVYCDIQNSEYKEDFYNDLRTTLINNGIKLRSDGTDAGLVIRTAFPQFKPKQVYDYGCALMMGEYDKIATKEFAKYVKEKSITKLIENHKQTVLNGDERKARMQRACTVILRLIENRETQSLAKFSEPLPAHHAENMFQSDSYTLMMLGTATRRADRENFYADVHVNLLLPPNFEVFKFTVNRLARHIIADVDEWEFKMDKLDNDVWCEDLREHLFSAELDAERKQAEVRRAYAEMAKIT